MSQEICSLTHPDSTVEVFMNKRRLGKTGLMVSEIGFGGEWLERHPEEESIKLIRYAQEKGINIIIIN